MIYSSENITGSILQSRLNYPAFENEKTYIIREQYTKQFDLVGDFMKHPSNSHCAQGLSYSNLSLPIKRNIAQKLYRNPLEAHLEKTGINERAEKGGLKSCHGNHFGTQSTHFVRSPFLGTPAYQEPRKHHTCACQCPHSANTHILPAWMSLDNHSVLISASSPSRSSLFWPSQAGHLAKRRDVKTPANLQFTPVCRYSLPNSNLKSMRSECFGAPFGGKFRDARSSYSQEPGQNCSIDRDLNEYSNKGSFWIKQNYPKLAGGLSYRYSNIESWDDHRSNAYEIEKRPRNILGSNDDRSRLKSKYRHGKRFVQRVLGVLRCDSHREKIFNEKDDEQQTYTEGLGKAQQWHYTNSANERGVEKFQRANFDSYRSEWRKNPDRWVTVSALCHSLESMCKKNRFLGETRKSIGYTRFNTLKVPYIPLAVYLKRIAWFFECSKECFVIALEYIHQLVRVVPDVKVNYTTVRQLIVAALRLSSKFNDDKFTRNSYYAHIVDLPNSTVAVFEAQMLFFLKFDLNVRPEQYYARYATMLADNQGPRKVTIWPGGN